MKYDDYSIPELTSEPPEDHIEPLGLPASTSPNDGLPASVQTEITILGAMLLDGVAVADAMAKLQPEDFLLDSHQRIFRVMVGMLENGENVDLITVMEALSKKKELDSIGGASYLVHLTEGIPRNASIESYVQIVKDKSLLRQLMSVFNSGILAAADQSEAGMKIATDAISSIAQVVEGSQTRNEVYDSPTMAASARSRLLDNPEITPALATGIKSIDDFTSGGIRLGELWVVGASPSRGKTTLARQIVKNAIRNGIPSYVHSGEMTKESWYDVTAALIVDMPAWKLREPHLLNLTEKDLLRVGLKELESLPFNISDAGGIHIDKLLWNAAREIRLNNMKLFVIDYAQIIQAHGRDPKERVSAVAQKLRIFAKDNNVATILLSQSPRPEGRSINARPNMFSLKESGSLEEAAHTVLLPFRLVDLETSAFVGDDEIIIAKQRWGSIGSIPVRLDGKYLKFVERVIDNGAY